MIITNNIAGRIFGAAFAAAVLIGAPMAAMTIAPSATAHAEPIDVINLGDLCPNGLPNDCDADGLSNDVEEAAGLDPLTPDTKLDLHLPKRDPVSTFLDQFGF
jgi:hypothetical protein